jgi:hypothetical protein
MARCWGCYSLYAGPIGALPRAGDEEWGREEDGSGMVVRFQLVARPYEIKAWGEGVDEWWVGSSLTSDVGGSMLFQRTVKR